MSLLFITLLRFVIAFLPQSKHLLISWLQSSSTVTLESEKMKLVTASNFSPSVFCEVMGTDAMILVFFNVVFKTAFHSLLSPLSRISLVPFHFLPLQWYHLHISGCYYSSLESSIIYDSSNIVFFFFWNPLTFFMIQLMLVYWSPVPLPFWNPACAFGSAQFTYCWRAWKILIIIFSMWNEHNCMVVSTSFVIVLLWDWNEN